jgi:glycine hydroxymethyltransferase
VTRLGLREPEMERIAEFVAAVLVEARDPAAVRRDVVDFRSAYQTVGYCFD